MYSKYIFKSIFFPKFFKNASFCSNIVFNIDGKTYQNSLTNVPSFIPIISTVS